MYGTGRRFDVDISAWNGLIRLEAIDVEREFASACQPRNLERAGLCDGAWRGGGHGRGWRIVIVPFVGEHAWCEHDRRHKCALYGTHSGCHDVEPSLDGMKT